MSINSGHIACSSQSRSEIVVPIRRNGVVTEIDVDSDELEAFDWVDAHYLEKICRLLK